MLEELNIEDTRANAERLFVRAELSPKNGDVFTPVDEWVFKVDQDIRPDWFVENYEKTRMRDAVKEWAKEHIHIGVNGLKISSGSNHYIKDCKDVEVCGNSTIEYVCGNSTIENVCGNSTIEYVYGNSTIKNVRENSTIKNVYGNSTIENVCGNSTIENVCGNSTIKNVYGNSTIKNVCGNSTIKNVCGNSTIENVCGNSTIEYVCGNSTIEYVYENSTIIGSSYGWNNKDKFIISENATFKDNEAKVIYQAGDWEVRLVDKEKNNDKGTV